MPNDKVVRLGERAGTQRADCSRALPNQLFSNRAASVVVPLFPERTHIARAEPDALKLVARLELENAELRRQAVELALQIQDLKDRWREKLHGRPF
jgi:hypothetical protein